MGATKVNGDGDVKTFSDKNIIEIASDQYLSFLEENYGFRRSSLQEQNLVIVHWSSTLVDVSLYNNTYTGDLELTFTQNESPDMHYTLQDILKYLSVDEIKYWHGYSDENLMNGICYFAAMMSKINDGFLEGDETQYSELRAFIVEARQKTIKERDQLQHIELAKEYWRKKEYLSYVN